MNAYPLMSDELKVYKQTELNQEKNLQFFLNKHSTKEGVWGCLAVHEGSAEFAFLDAQGKELSFHVIHPESPALIIPPASWHKIVSTSSNFNATLKFYCASHRYFEKKYRLTPIHQDLWSVYLTYFRHLETLSVLDIGCGSGRNPLYFAQAGHKVWGVDKNESALTNIRQIAEQEHLSDIHVHMHDLNQPLALPEKTFDFIYSTVTLQFLKPSSIEPLLAQLQSLTAAGGMHFLVFPVRDESYIYPESFSYLAEKQALYHFYQDSGWSILEYREKPGQLHKLDEHGRPRQGMFGSLLAMKHDGSSKSR